MSSDGRTFGRTQLRQYAPPNFWGSIKPKLQKVLVVRIKANQCNESTNSINTDNITILCTTENKTSHTGNGDVSI
jgi:hypothetical protein